MSSSKPSPRPHILAVPFYLPGHEIPLLHLCQHLVSSGNCVVSFLQSPRSKQFAPNKSSSSFSSPFLTLHTLPEHLLPEVNSFQDFKLYHDAFDQLGDSIAREWKDKQLTCIITDVFVGWGKYVAEAFSVPWIAFWTSSTTELAVYMNIPASISKGSESHECGVSSISIPGLPEIQASDYPTILHLQNAEFPTKFLIDGFVHKVGLTVHADRALVNTALALEGDAVDSLKQSGVNVVPIGPLHLLSEHQGKGEDGVDDPTKVLPWLDEQLDSSVLFIAFGTTSMMPPGQIQQLALALQSSAELRFLWVVRTTEYADQIPPGFSSIARFCMREKNENVSESSSHRGMVTDWVPQKEVLKHRAVSGFLTHCGWNSVLESISSGTPMITRPFEADQLLTSKLLKDQWGVSVRVPGIMASMAIGKQELEEAIEEHQLSCDALRKRAGELGKQVKEEMEHSKGASWLNLNAFVEDLRSWSSKLTALDEKV